MLNIDTKIKAAVAFVVLAIGLLGPVLASLGMTPDLAPITATVQWLGDKGLVITAAVGGLIAGLLPAFKDLLATLTGSSDQPPA